MTHNNMMYDHDQYHSVTASTPAYSGHFKQPNHSNPEAYIPTDIILCEKPVYRT